MEEMNNEKMCNPHKEMGCCGGKKWKSGKGASPCGLYGVAILGAAVYYIQHADTFWMGVLGVLKAIIWPAMLIYKAFGILGM